ncbi:MAG: gamma-glutamyltransferase [Ilumatobacteraceae bacterium]
MVCAADQLATQAGASVLARGGNAVDAAIATNAMMAVVAPHLCGLGGDLFAIVHRDGDPAPTIVNASGRAGSEPIPRPSVRRPYRDALPPRRPNHHRPGLCRRLAPPP